MSRIHHVNIRIVDAERSVAFYRALGLEITGTLALAPGYTLLFMGEQPGGEVALELVLNETTDSAYDRSVGSGHVGVEVDDLHATLATLAAMGVVPEGAPAHPGDRNDLGLVAFVRDPDGVRVELLQSPWPIPQDALPEALASIH